MAVTMHTRPRKRQRVDAPDPTTSHLFRLPTELREKIWGSAYGNMKIHVHDDHVKHRVAASRPPTLRYRVCLDDRNPIMSTPFHAGCCSKTWKYLEPMHLPLVSRQFWSEASKVFLASSTWIFQYPFHLQLLLKEQKHLAGRMHRLDLRINHLAEWSSTLSCPAVSKLDSLQGLTLIIHEFRPVHLWRSWESFNRKGYAEIMKWTASKFPKVVRAFQQHRLKEGLTSVALLIYAPDADVPSAEAAIRGHLLEPHPRHHTGCGLSKVRLAEVVRRQR